MIEQLPYSINILFIITTFLTVYLFYKSTKNSHAALYLILFWLLFQGVIGYSKFYTFTNSIPPRFSLLIVPVLLLILFLFLNRNGKIFLDSLDLKTLTYLQTVRVPVEICLYLLFINGQIPKLMTFEGRNFDILAGLTAPLVAYFGFVKKSLSNRAIMIWNIICIILLINIVANAALSAPFPFQQFAFDQPNIAVLYFPFVWLPCFIVPAVLLAHLVSLRQLTDKNKFKIT